MINSILCDFYLRLFILKIIENCYGFIRDELNGKSYDKRPAS
jgi:hypothetical protein